MILACTAFCVGAACVGEVQSAAEPGVEAAVSNSLPDAEDAEGDAAIPADALARATLICRGREVEALPSYQLDSYTSSTGGLCPAPSAMGCSCDMFTPGEVVLAAPPEQTLVACRFSGGCPMDPVCGWRIDGNLSWGDDFDEVLDCIICTTDSHCGDGRRCTRRIDNLMVCEDAAEDAGSD